jgi:hypothetical protein
MLFKKFFFFKHIFFNPFLFNFFGYFRFSFFKNKGLSLINLKNFFFKSKFLRKSRLYFFFKFYFKSKKILTAFFSKSSFFRNNFNKLGGDSFFKKSGFFFDRQMEIPLNFFLIWVFFKKVRKLKRGLTYHIFLKYKYKKHLVFGKIYFL